MATSAEPMQGHGSRLGRRLLIGALVIVALIIVIRLVLDPFASWATRRALNDAEGIDGAFQRVHVTVFPPGYEIHRLALVPDGSTRWKRPWIYIESLHTRLSGSALLRGRLASTVVIQSPKLRLPGGPKQKGDEPTKSLPKLLEELPGFKVTRIEVHDGEVLATIPAEIDEPIKDAVNDGKLDEDQNKDVDKEDVGKPGQLWAHGIEMAIENITTRRQLSGGQPVNFSMRGKVEKSGVMKGFGTTDLFAERPRFAGRFELKGLALNRLFDIIAPRTGLQATKGEMDLFVEATAENGHIKGGLKPLLRNVEIETAEDKWTSSLKAWLVDKGVNLVSDRVEGRNAVATTVPIRGDLSNPEVQIYPAILGMFRNAFVTALASGFFNLPPPSANKEQGMIKQAVEALGGDDPPKAQPAEGSNGKK